MWETFDYVLYDAKYDIDDDIMVNNSMYLWTEQPGYPLVTVEYNNGSIVLTQVKHNLRTVFASYYCRYLRSDRNVNNYRLIP